jgi:hypothetical protein
MRTSKLGTAFNQLDHVISEHAALWQEKPFVSKQLAWFKYQPALKHDLLSLDDQTAHALHRDPVARIDWFRQRMPELCDALYNYSPEPIQAHTDLSIGPFDQVGIPGRKWLQVLAFAKSLNKINTPIIDWCSGKGHLSRVVQRSMKQPVHCLEWDQKLVDLGSKLAKRDRLEIYYHHQNVLAPLPDFCAHPEHTFMALHACGDLHIEMLKHVAYYRSKALILSPCCYQKTKDQQYRPLSMVGKKSQIQLDRSALQLAVQETVTASQGEQRKREKTQRWRLGFDALQRDVRKTDQYLSIPSIKNHLLTGSFASFCQWAAKERQLTLPDDIDYDLYLRRGEDRYGEVFRLELLRRLFNRPLELWLALDRALYLEEQNYMVTLSTFCDRTLSPRNLLIQATRI